MSANKVLKNSIANIIAKIWSILSLYIFVPIWIHFLGVEGYGIISFYTILMTIMHFADAGLTATLTREFARDDKDERYKRNLLRTIELIYFCIAFLLFLIIFIFSNHIVKFFLKSDIYSYEYLCNCVQIMGLSLAMHFLYSMYSGGLFGLQKQVLGNVISISYSVSRSAIVILPLLWWPTIKIFLWWQLLSIIVALVFVRFFVIKSITTSGKDFSFHTEHLKSIWGFALGMMLMAIISALNTQLDKLITGNVLSLENMAYYSLASTVGVAVLSIVQPLGVAFYPELTRLISNDRHKVVQPFLSFTYVLSMISTAIGITLFLYVDELIYLWTHNQEITNVIKYPARLLIVGNIFQSLQLSPYYLALSNGHTKTNVKLGICMLLFTMPSVYFFTKQWGINGTAIPFVFLNVISTFYLGFVIINKFFLNKRKEWIVFTIVPGLISLIIIYVFYLLGLNVENENIRLIYGLFSCLFSIYISFVALIKIVPETTNYFPSKIFRLLFPYFKEK